ncbi:MAG TPA: NAD(P)H-hydrate dehydratase [Candidatus Binataceae bacterium]|nr:NAD(P)H-hydrate dehydratase [Candidatus Binataceae bacterium]
MKIVTAAEMREIDRRTTEEFGIPSLTLMENAGSAVAEFCLREYPDAKTVGVICGKGNNGGDGFVAARKLHEAGKTVRVLLLADPREVKGDAVEMLKRLPVQPVIARNEEELESDSAQQVFNSDLLVDAILGTGFKPPVNELYKSAIDVFWEPNAPPVISVDLPSGAVADEIMANSSEAARSSAIVTFTAPKQAQVFQSLTDGPIIVAKIGSPREAITSRLGLEAIVSDDLNFLRGPRRDDSNKGDFGHVLVVGGSRGKAGAAAMAGMAAMRAGAGLCTVACPVGVQSLISSFMPELMTEELRETQFGSLAISAAEQVTRIVRGKSVLALGPGISRNPEAAQVTREIVKTVDMPIVLDADGLNAFEGHTELLNGKERALVLTPHPGEMARLTGLSVAEVEADRIGVARSFAQLHQCIVVLKGWRTVVADTSGGTWINMTGNPGMATGGTGDVLTGMIAAMIGKCVHLTGVAHLTAVMAAVHLHGRAGDLACRKLGSNAMTATDVIANIGLAYQELFWNSRLTLLKPTSPEPWWRRRHKRLV